MSILKTLLGLLKAVLPFLRTAAEKAFKKLPKEKQDELIAISKMVEIIKQLKGKDTDEVFAKISELTGLDKASIVDALIAYYQQKGIVRFGIKDIFEPIWNDAAHRTETGLKSLWSGISNIISSTVAEIDWQLLLMGVGEFVYRTFVKGKVKV